MSVNAKNDEMVMVSFGKEYRVKLVLNKYKAFGSLYIGLVYWDEEDELWEPFDELTVGLDFLMPGYAFVNTNHIPDAEEFIQKYHLGKPTGTIKKSGFCQYPLYEFDMEVVNRYLA